jgi:hypothetical protein
MIGLQISIANGECLLSLEILLKLREMQKAIEALGADYKEFGTVLKLIQPEILGQVLTTLRAIAAEVNPDALRGMTPPDDAARGNS